MLFNIYAQGPTVAHAIIYKYCTHKPHLKRDQRQHENAPLHQCNRTDLKTFSVCLLSHAGGQKIKP